MPSEPNQLARVREADRPRIVREALRSDAVAIRRILSEAQLSIILAMRESGTAGSDQTVAKHTHVCELDKKVVAVLQWRQVGQEAEIFDVAVDTKHRRQGIATVLLENVLSQAKLRGLKAFYLEVRESNVAALALYGRLGFAVTGRRPDYYRNPTEAALLLQLRISA